MWIGHREEIQKLTFWALALRQGESIRSEGLILETSAFQSLYGGQFTLSTRLIKQNYQVRKLAARALDLEWKHNLKT